MNNTSPSVKPQPPAVLAKPPSRMQLGAVVKGKLQKPPRVLLFGVDKIGKSTFAANAPSPIFICAEDGTSELNVERFPEPKTWTETLEAVDVLATSDHPYKTLVIDTLDWLEPLCWAHVCSKGGKPDIESFGFGKGYTAALDEWRALLARLDRVRAVKQMEIILLCHAWIKPFKNPEGDDFDRYELKLHAKTGGLIKEWVDAVLFATFEVFTHSKDGRTKGVSSGARVVHTQRRAAFDSGNRFDLPEVMPLDWSTFADHVASHRPGAPAAIRKQIEQTLTDTPTLEAKVVDGVKAAVQKAGDDAAELARIADKLLGLIQMENPQ